MNHPNKQSLIAMIEAYAASKAEVALESSRPDQDCGYSLLQKEKKCVENKESLFNFIDKLNLDPIQKESFFALTQPEPPFYGNNMEASDIDKYFKSEIEEAKNKASIEYWRNNDPNDAERLYYPAERCEPSEDSDLEYNYDTDNDPLISM